MSSQFDAERAQILNVANFAVELLFSGSGDHFFYGEMPFAAGQFLMVVIGSWPARNADPEDQNVVGSKWSATAKVSESGRTRVLSVVHRRGVSPESRHSIALTHGDSFYTRAGADDVVADRPQPDTMEEQRRGCTAPGPAPHVRRVAATTGHAMRRGTFGD